MLYSRNKIVFPAQTVSASDYIHTGVDLCSPSEALFGSFFEFKYDFLQCVRSQSQTGCRVDVNRNGFPVFSQYWMALLIIQFASKIALFDASIRIFPHPHIVSHRDRFAPIPVPDFFIISSAALPALNQIRFFFRFRIDSCANSLCSSASSTDSDPLRADFLHNTEFLLPHIHHRCGSDFVQDFIRRFFRHSSSSSSSSDVRQLCCENAFVYIVIIFFIESLMLILPIV
jgi:hypothetical protein